MTDLPASAPPPPARPNPVTAASRRWSRRSRRLTAVAAAIVVVAAAVGVGLLATGGGGRSAPVLRTISPAGTSCQAPAGLAYDGASLLVSCPGSTTITAVHPGDGSVATTIAGHGDGLDSLGPLAWDRARSGLWACGDGAIWWIDPISGAATKAFVPTHDCAGGLAYDGVRDKLWVREAGVAVLDSYSVDGDPGSSRPIPPTSCPGPGPGLAAGGDDLVVASGNCRRLEAVAVDGSQTVGLAATSTRVGPLACDDRTFRAQGQVGLWSTAAGGRLQAIEVPAGTCGFGGLPSNHDTAVVAFGDSIAAGFGSGDAAGFPDNPAAYPARLGADLGTDSFNFAVSGACATSPGGDQQSSGQCTGSVFDDQRAAARSQGLHPGLVTLTVGANDIAFVACVQAAIGLPIDQPCQGPGFDDHLAALEVGLGQAVDGIHALYPDAPIAVTSYFVPVPPAPGDGVPLCPSMPIGDAARLLFVDGDATRAATLAATGRLDDDAEDFQKALADQATAVATALDATIGRAAFAHAATFVPLDFTGHDFCTDYPDGGGGPAWVLAPSLQAAANLPGGLLAGTLSWTAVPAHRCTPTPTCDSVDITRTFDVFGTGTGFSFSLQSNAFPHLTPDGGQAVADAVRARLSPP